MTNKRVGLQFSKIRHVYLIPQKTTTLHNSYLVKVATLGGGGQNSEKNGYVVCVWPLIKTKKPNSGNYRHIFYRNNRSDKIYAYNFHS